MIELAPDDILGGTSGCLADRLDLTSRSAGNATILTPDLNGICLVSANPAVFRSRDPSAIRAFLDTALACSPGEVCADPGDAGFRCATFVDEHASSYLVQHSLAGQTEFAPRDRFLVAFFKRHSGEVVINGRLTPLPPRASFILPPNRGALLQHPEGLDATFAVIEREVLENRLRRAFCVAVATPLEFRQPGEYPDYFLEFIQDPVTAGLEKIFVAKPEVRFAILAGLGSNLVTRLLVFGQHNYSSQIAAEGKQAGRSGRLKALEEHIRDNLETPLKVGDISRIYQMSYRSLVRDFRREFGETPVQYIRNLRLRKACQMLLQGDETTSVLATAYKCGFNSLGHFANVYEKLFGELPSETLRKARPRP